MDPSGHAIGTQKSGRHSCQTLSTERGVGQSGHQFLYGRAGSAVPRIEIKYQTLDGRRQVPGLRLIRFDLELNQQ